MTDLLHRQIGGVRRRLDRIGGMIDGCKGAIRAVDRTVGAHQCPIKDFGADLKIHQRLTEVLCVTIDLRGGRTQMLQRVGNRFAVLVVQQITETFTRRFSGPGPSRAPIGPRAVASTVWTE